MDTLQLVHWSDFRPVCNVADLAEQGGSDIVAALELAFATKGLRQTCESQLKAERELGMKVAEKLRARLADLRAARTIEDVIAGKPEARPDGHVTLELADGVCALFSANHVTNPVTKSGEINWQKINRLKLVRIERPDG